MLRHALRTATVRACFAGLLALTPASALHAQDGPDERVGATECCLPLLFPIGARAVGLGNALAALAGADALFVNPAALALLRRDEFRVHNAPTDIETTNTFGFGIRLRNAGVLGIAYHLADYGESEARDEQGIPTGTIRILSHMLLASFATTMAPGVTAGVSYKLFQSRQDCTGICGAAGLAPATTHGVDLGAQYRPGWLPSLQLGVALLHAGLPLQVENAAQASPLPTRGRLGAAYEVLHHFKADSALVLWASMDVTASHRQGVPGQAGIGLELGVDETIFVRAGYASGSGRNAGAGLGVALRYDRLELGISRSFLATSLGGADPFQITFAINF